METRARQSLMIISNTEAYLQAIQVTSLLDNEPFSAKCGHELANYLLDLLRINSKTMFDFKQRRRDVDTIVVATSEVAKEHSTVAHNPDQELAVAWQKPTG